MANGMPLTRDYTTGAVSLIDETADTIYAQHIAPVTLNADLLLDANGTGEVGLGKNGAGPVQDTRAYGDFYVDGAEVVTGGTNFNGDVTIGDAAADTLIINASLGSHVIPDANDAYAFGSTLLGYAEFWLSEVGGATARNLNASGAGVAGAKAIGVDPVPLTYSANFDLQSVLGDLDSAIGAADIFQLGAGTLSAQRKGASLTTAGDYAFNTGLSNDINSDSNYGVAIGNTNTVYRSVHGTAFGQMNVVSGDASYNSDFSVAFGGGPALGGIIWDDRNIVGGVFRRYSAAGNNIGDPDIVVQAAIDPDTPATGIVFIDGDEYVYTGWAIDTFALFSNLIKNYNLDDLVYVSSPATHNFVHGAANEVGGVTGLGFNIVLGAENVLSEATYNAVFGSDSRLVNLSAVNLVSGDSHVLDASSTNCVTGAANALDTCVLNAVFGTDNTLTNANVNVVGGNDNAINNSQCSLIVGYENKTFATGAAVDANFIAGRENEIYATCLYSGAIGILNKLGSVVETQGSLAVGNTNTIEGGAVNKHYNYAFGSLNQIEGGFNTTIGSLNHIDDSEHAFCQGESNYIHTGSNYSIAMCGGDAGGSLNNDIGTTNAVEYGIALGAANILDHPNTGAVHLVGIGSTNQVEGNSCAAIGWSNEILTEASGDTEFCFAIGRENKVNESAAIGSVQFAGAIGDGNIVKGPAYVYALGSVNEVYASYSGAVGASNVVGNDATPWDLADYCWAFGYSNQIAINAIPKALYSYAFGCLNEISNIADSDFSVAIGCANQVNADYAFAAGVSNIINGDNSWTLGEGNQVDGQFSLSSGYDNIIYSDYSSVGAGKDNVINVDSDYTSVFGDTNIIGNVYNSPYSMAVGYNISIEGNAATELGYNYAFGNSHSIGADYVFVAGLSTNIEGDYSAAFGATLTAGPYTDGSIIQGVNNTVNDGSFCCAVFGGGMDVVEGHTLGTAGAVTTTTNGLSVVGSQTINVASTVGFPAIGDIVVRSATGAYHNYRYDVLNPGTPGSVTLLNPAGPWEAYPGGSLVIAGPAIASSSFAGGQGHEVYASGCYVGGQRNVIHSGSRNSVVFGGGVTAAKSMYGVDEQNIIGASSSAPYCQWSFVHGVNNVVDYGVQFGASIAWGGLNVVYGDFNWAHGAANQVGWDAAPPPAASALCYAWGYGNIIHDGQGSIFVGGGGDGGAIGALTGSVVGAATAASYSFVWGGQNDVDGNALGANVAFGSNHNIDADYAFASGDAHIISGDYSSAFGYTHTVSGDYSVTFGTTNDISGDYSAAFGSTHDIDSDYCFTGGYLNVLQGDYSSVIGSTNTINTGSTCGSILGYNNAIGATQLSTYGIAIGRDNVLDTRVGGTSTELTAVGSTNTVEGTHNAAFGQGNVINVEAAIGTILECVAVGHDNNININNNLTVESVGVFGWGNQVHASNSYGIGKSNVIYSRQSGGVGLSNTVGQTGAPWTNADGSWGFGTSNQIGVNGDTAQWSYALGHGNLIGTTANASNSFAVGEDNSVQAGYAGALGYSNTITGQSWVIGNHCRAEADMGLVTGYYAEGRWYNAITHSGWTIDTDYPGEFQTVVDVHLSRTTSDATVTLLHPDGNTAGEDLDLQDDTAYVCNLLIVAKNKDTDDEVKAWQLMFLVDRSNGTTNLVGVPNKIIIAAEGAATSTWDVDVDSVATAANDQIEIDVTGEALTNIYWSGSLRVAEVCTAH